MGDSLVLFNRAQYKPVTVVRNPPYFDQKIDFHS